MLLAPASEMPGLRLTFGFFGFCGPHLYWPDLPTHSEGLARSIHGATVARKGGGAR